jgi:hypothetical protein
VGTSQAKAPLPKLVLQALDAARGTISIRF